MNTRLSIRANAGMFQLTVQPKLSSIAPTVLAGGPESQVRISLPHDFLPLNEGDQVILNLGIVFAGIEPDTPAPTSGLILPGMQ